MIPIYQALTYEGTIEQGGRNRPWIVSVKTNQGIEAYVAKLYTEDDIQDNNALLKEVYGAAFAREIDLNTPNFCLIEFSNQFYESLPEVLKEEYNRKHSRCAFGSKYLNGAPTFSPSQKFHELKDYEIETIYAFDVTIRNTDRRLGKPNILFYEKEAYLIDHEHSFLIQPEDQPLRVLEIYPYQQHIFHSVLKNRMKRAKDKPDFELFLEIFRNSRTHSIIECADVLRGLGYETDDSLVIELYINRLRQNQDILRQRLIGSLQ